MPKYTATFLRITFLYKIIHVININATFKIYVKFTFINIYYAFIKQTFTEIGLYEFQWMKRKIVDVSRGYTNLLPRQTRRYH